MKCLLTNGKGDLTLSDIEEPRIQPGHVILKTGYASICGTDFSIINGDGPPWTSYPVVLGHEFSGTIEEIGKDVEDVQVGDEVVVDNYISCHACYYCKKGAYFYCDHHREPGITINGGFARILFNSLHQCCQDTPGSLLKACSDRRADGKLPEGLCYR